MQSAESSVTGRVPPTRAPEPSDDVIVITAANPWHEHRMADRQLADALSRFGRVLYVDPPTLGRGGVESARPTGTVEVLRPTRLPLINFPLTAYLSRHLTALQIRRRLRQMGAARTLLVEANVMSPVVGLVGEIRSVYWAQDDWEGLAQIVGLNANLIKKNERALVQQCSAVIAANPVNALRLREERPEVALVPFGASTQVFEAATTPEDAGGEPGPALLMGTLNSRIDFGFLASVVRAGVPLLLVGPVTEDVAADGISELQRLGDVEHREQVPFLDLAPLLAKCSVGLVPYNHSPFNEGSFPLKTLEYLAAGLPVVATDLPAIRWLECDDIDVVDDASGFACAVHSAVAQGRPAPADRHRRQAFARNHDWTARARQFHEVLVDVGEEHQR